MHTMKLCVVTFFNVHLTDNKYETHTETIHNIEKFSQSVFNYWCNNCKYKIARTILQCDCFYKADGLCL